MKSRRHGYVIIQTPEGKTEGIATEWDFLSKLTAEAKDPAKVKLSEIMTTELITVNPKDEFDEVSRIMSERGIRRVIVVEQGRVLGIITARIILRRLREHVDRVSTQIARLTSYQI
jgi:CBS domain-containing protein